MFRRAALYIGIAVLFIFIIVALFAPFFSTISTGSTCWGALGATKQFSSARYKFDGARSLEHAYLWYTCQFANRVSWWAAGGNNRNRFGHHLRVLRWESRSISDDADQYHHDDTDVSTHSIVSCFFSRRISCLSVFLWGYWAGHSVPESSGLR
jgi:hypothetical protein